MGVFQELYERLVRRFQRQKVKQTSLKRTQSLPRDPHKDRATIVVRPRSNTTEVTIERRRVSSRTDWNRINKSIEKQAENQNESKRERGMSKTDTGSPTKAIVITRTGDCKKIGGNGSILAPTYRTRAASVKQQQNVITISI